MHFMTVNIQFSYLLCVLLFSFFTQKLPSLQLFVERKEYKIIGWLCIANLSESKQSILGVKWILLPPTSDSYVSCVVVSISFQNRTWWQCAKYAPGSNQFDKFGGDRQTEQTEQTDNWQTIVFFWWDHETWRSVEKRRVNIFMKPSFPDVNFRL